MSPVYETFVIQNDSQVYQRCPETFETDCN